MFQAISEMVFVESVQNSNIYLVESNWFMGVQLSHIVRTPPLPFLKGGGGLNFNYLPQRGDSEQIKKGVEVWWRGRSS